MWANNFGITYQRFNQSVSKISSINTSKTILTDVGSVKEPIVNTWENLHPLFIGSHPMAGIEKKELIQVLKGLFKNAKWIITPSKIVDLNAVRLFPSS